MLFGIFSAKPAPIEEEPRPEVILPKGWDSKRGGYYPTEEELAEEEAIRQEYARTGFKDEPWKLALLKPRWSTDEDPPVNPFAVIQWDKHNAEFDEPVELPYVEPGPPKPPFKRYIALALVVFYLISLISAYLERRKKAQQHFFKLRRRHGIPDSDLRPWPIAQEAVIQRRHDRENLWRMENGLAPLWDNEEGVTIVLKEWDERGRPLPPKPTPEQIAQEKWEKKFSKERKRLLKSKRANGAAFEHPGAFQLSDDDKFDNEIDVPYEVEPAPEPPKALEVPKETPKEEKIARSKITPAAPGERTRHRLPDPPKKAPSFTRPLHPAHTQRTDSVDVDFNAMSPLELAAYRMRERWAWNLHTEQMMREQAIKYGEYIERPTHPDPLDAKRPQTELLVQDMIPRTIDQSRVVIPDFRSMYGPQKKKSTKTTESEKREREREPEAPAQRASKKAKRESAVDKADVPNDNKGKGKAKAKDIPPPAAANDAMDVDSKDTKEPRTSLKRRRDENVSETGASEQEPARKRAKGPKGERAIPRTAINTALPDSKRSPETATTQLDSKKSPVTGKTTPPTIEDMTTSPGASTVEPLDLDNMDGVRVDANGRPMRGDPCKGRKEGEQWVGRKWRMRVHDNERERLCAVVCQEKMRGFGLPGDEFTVHLWLNDEKYAQAVVSQRLDSGAYEAISLEPVVPRDPKNVELQKAGLRVLLGRKRSPTPPKSSPKKAQTPLRSPPVSSPALAAAEPVIEATPTRPSPEASQSVVHDEPATPTSSTYIPGTPIASSTVPAIAIIAPTPPGVPSSPVSNILLAEKTTPTPSAVPLPSATFTPMGFHPVETKNVSPAPAMPSSSMGPQSSLVKAGNDFFARPPNNHQPLSTTTPTFRNPFEQQTTTSTIPTVLGSPMPSQPTPGLAQQPVHSTQQPQHRLNPLAAPFMPSTPSSSTPQLPPSNVHIGASSQPHATSSHTSNQFSFSFNTPGSLRSPLPAASQWPTRSSPLANEILPDKPDVTVNQMVLDPVSEVGQGINKRTEADEILLTNGPNGASPLNLFFKDGVPRFSSDGALGSPSASGPSFASLSPGPGFAPLIAAQQNCGTPTQASPGINTLTPGLTGLAQSNPPLGVSQGGFTAGATSDEQRPRSGESSGVAGGSSGSPTKGHGRSASYGWTADGRRIATNTRIMKSESSKLTGVTFSNVPSTPVASQATTPTGVAQGGSTLTPSQQGSTDMNLG